jgi:alanyl-tRNA synthetase
MKKEEALATGAMALFGEKYGDTVRVVTIDPSYSIELCGGTHVGNTGELGFFKIITETAVGAGIRRIEALSGNAAEDYIQREFDTMHHIRESLKNPKDINKSVENLIAENNDLKKQLEKLEAKQLLSIKNDLLKKVEKINGVNFIGQIVDAPNADALKKICFLLKNEFENYVIVLAADIDNKAGVAVILDENILFSKNLDASKIIKDIAPLIKGGGGGQKTLATAGGQDASKLNDVIEKVRSLL